MFHKIFSFVANVTIWWFENKNNNGGCRRYAPRLTPRRGQPPSSHRHYFYFLIRWSHFVPHCYPINKRKNSALTMLRSFACPAALSLTIAVVRSGRETQIWAVRGSARPSPKFSFAGCLKTELRQIWDVKRNFWITWNDEGDFRRRKMAHPFYGVSHFIF